MNQPKEQLSNKTKNADDRDLTQGPIWKKLYKIAVPMIFGIIAVMSTTMVDTYFISKLGTEQLAALSFTFPVTLTIMSLAIGLSAGAASIVSRALGANDNRKVCRASTDALMLSTIMVLIICTIGYFTITPLFSLIGADGDVLEYLRRYMRIWYLSMPFLVIPMVSNGLIRSTGDSFWPSLIMIVSALINVALTPTLMFGYGPFPTLDIEGCAIATMISYISTFLFSSYIIYFREKMVTFKIPPFDEILKSWKEIARIALPASAGNAVNPLAIGIVTSFIAAFGPASVAAFGAATRIESFVAIVMLALSSAIGPVAGQNWGAGNKGRVIKAQKTSFFACGAWALIMSVVLYFFSDLVATLFASDENVEKEIALYLNIIPITLWGYGVTITAAGCYNAIGKSLTGLGFYLTRSAIFYVPLGWLASIVFNDVIYMFYAIGLANVLAGIVIGAAAIYKMKSLEA